MPDTSDKTTLAEERTDWAEDRTLLAIERTFSSWNGLGLGMVAVALGLRAVFSAADPTWIAKLVASLFLAAAVFTYAIAWRQACKSRDRLQARDAEAGGSRAYSSISALLIAATLATGAVLWSL